MRLSQEGSLLKYATSYLPYKIGDGGKIFRNSLSARLNSCEIYQNEWKMLLLGIFQNLCRKQSENPMFQNLSAKLNSAKFDEFDHVDRKIKFRENFLP